MALTETEIKALRTDPRRHRWVNDGGGLYLRVSPTGRKSWVWRAKRAGKTSYTTLGEWPALTVRQARDELAKRTGRATPPNALTVSDALDEWFEHHIEGRYRVTKNVRVYLNRAKADFGRRRLQELTRAEIARFLRGYAKRSPVAANRCLSTLKLAFSWCVETGYLDASPADALTRRIAGGDEATRARVLTDDEIRALWAWDHPAGRLCRFLLLTALRIREAQLAAETDIEGDRLQIPAVNAKNRRAHWVHLTPLARAQIEPEASPRLFTAASPTQAQAAVKRRQEPSADRWTPHDLRRTFATRLGDLGVAPHVIERCLNHTPQGVAAIYNRSELAEERIAATRAWEAELQRILKEGHPGPR